jgi:hypothetical protein
MIRMCKTCGLPSNTKRISFNNKGICSYCEFYNNFGVNLYDVNHVKDLFQKRIDTIKGKYEYDALVGISGGKDGAYVLHRLVRDYGLKVLTVTYDNQFMGEGVRGRIDSLTKEYNVDHFYYYPENLKSLYKGILKVAGVPCDACAMTGYYGAIKISLERKIPFFVHGRSTFQMLRNLDEKTYKKDPFFALLKTNLEEYKPKKIMKLYKKMYNSIRWRIMLLPNISLKDKIGIIREFFTPLSKIKSDFVPESFAYFLTEEYDEPKIRKILKEEGGYVSPPSHEDCKIHNAANYLFSLQQNIAIDVLETAAMVRKGFADKKEFEELFEQRKKELETPSEEIKKELDLVLDTLDIDYGDVKNLKV